MLPKEAVAKQHKVVVYKADLQGIQSTENVEMEVERREDCVKQKEDALDHQEE